MAKYKGQDVDLTPTSAMAAEAGRALAWRKEGHKGGTAVGVARAVQLKNKTELSASTVKRMHSFFSRHEVDKQAEGFSPGEKGYPSPGRVAWAMWGGDAGQSWARSKTKTFASLDKKSTAKCDGEATTRQVTIKRIDEEKRVVYGEVYAPYVLDTYGEFMTPEDIELMAHRFMRLDLGTVIDTQHDNVPNGSFPVESFVAREGDPDYTPGAWVLGVKIPDDGVWQAVKSGVLNGFSFQSLVRPRDVEVVYSVVRDHMGETEPVDGGHHHLYFVQVDEMGKVIGGRTNEVDGHSHEIRRASVTDVAAAHSHRFFL
jgi:hypothetical protein